MPTIIGAVIKRTVIELLTQVGKKGIMFDELVRITSQNRNVRIAYQSCEDLPNLVIRIINIMVGEGDIAKINDEVYLPELAYARGEKKLAKKYPDVDIRQIEAAVAAILSTDEPTGSAEVKQAIGTKYKDLTGIEPSAPVIHDLLRAAVYHPENRIKRTGRASTTEYFLKSDAEMAAARHINEATQQAGGTIIVDEMIVGVKTIMGDGHSFNGLQLLGTQPYIASYFDELVKASMSTDGLNLRNIQLFDANDEIIQTSRITPSTVMIIAPNDDTMADEGTVTVRIVRTNVTSVLCVSQIAGVNTIEIAEGSTFGLTLMPFSESFVLAADLDAQALTRIGEIVLKNGDKEIDKIVPNTRHIVFIRQLSS